MQPMRPIKLSSFIILILFYFVSGCLCLHDIIDLTGWDPIPVDSVEAKEAMVKAAQHIKGMLIQPITAFQQIENVPSWNLYRLSFRVSFRGGIVRECYSDVLRNLKPFFMIVFNVGCMTINQPVTYA